MTVLVASPKRRIGLVVWLIVSQLLAIGSLAIWAVVAGLSVMAFDSGSTPEACAIVITVWAYPHFPLVMAIGAWIAFAVRKNKLASVLSTLAFLPPVLFFIFIFVTSITGPQPF